MPGKSNKKQEPRQEQEHSLSSSGTLKNLLDYSIERQSRFKEAMLLEILA